MYLLITIIRNYLFSHHLIQSRKYSDVFVLCVGNIRVGGTGKTPMVEYLIRHLQNIFPLAVVSLGYKRKMKGLHEIQDTDTAQMVGDEPKQMSEKFPNIKFIVSKDRNEAIDYIRNKYKEIKLIILDDAMQYRKTTPTHTILLTEYNRPYFSDHIIPYGRLRESKRESKRANTIIVTKCEHGISDKEKREFTKQLDINEDQKVFFSTIKYYMPEDLDKTKSLLFIAGIDNPMPAVDFLQKQDYTVTLLKYPDHHTFTKEDILQIQNKAKNNYQIITTEKDAVRLREYDISFSVLKIENEIDNNFLDYITNEIRTHIRS